MVASCDRACNPTVKSTHAHLRVARATSKAYDTDVSANTKLVDWISPEKYLEGERFAKVRHEYVEGRVYAMAGASDDHNRIVNNLITSLTECLRGKPCEAFAVDERTRALSTG